MHILCICAGLSQFPFGLGLLDRARWPSSYQCQDLCPGVSRSYPGPAVSSTCGPWKCNPPLFRVILLRAPQRRIREWMNLGCVETTFPLSCDSSPWVGAGLVRLPRSGLELMTSQSLVQHLNHLTTGDLNNTVFRWYFSGEWAFLCDITLHPTLVHIYPNLIKLV